MRTLEEILEAVDHLSDDDLAKLQQEIKVRRLKVKRHQFATPAERIQALREGFAELRAGLSEEDLAEIIWAMNHKYVDPKDLTMWDWLDDIPADER